MTSASSKVGYELNCDSATVVAVVVLEMGVVGVGVVVVATVVGGSAVVAGATVADDSDVLVVVESAVASCVPVIGGVVCVVVDAVFGSAHAARTTINTEHNPKTLSDQPDRAEALLSTYPPYRNRQGRSMGRNPDEDRTQSGHIRRSAPPFMERITGNMGGLARRSG
jgi:hypothetical protein